VRHVDDRIEPRAEQILLAALTSFPWLHRNSLRLTATDRENHGFGCEGIPKLNLQGRSRQNTEIWQLPSSLRSKSTNPLNGLGILHGRLMFRSCR
jgi:hypothetical protein